VSRAARVRPIAFPAPAPVASAPSSSTRAGRRRRRPAAAPAVAVAAALLTAWCGGLTEPRRCVAQVTETPSAQIFPDPSKFAYGLYTQGELGAVTMFGSAGPHLKPGWAMGAVLGYDLARFLAIEARAVGSTHLTRFPSAPQDGELVQLYHLLGALKLSLRWRQLAFFADATAFARPNLADSVALIGTAHLRYVF
jgi:hypothetical protein